ncbi:DUF4097 family beta strand repeat-containing protein [Rummeliibacillus sp. TYF-LIM-RU47]|uniref:DUF4097 family beta strand repeat-containing protein n=1 Tax=Rummeliibacillus sp. TYF-LIM-RU47 TaxID=2608406 RepID=UPI00123BB9B4|nr:DUF4097 family beta strand repeat-containing protein [Rummeliibacillus sp. TYF-LIM-RU47]
MNKKLSILALLLLLIGGVGSYFTLSQYSQEEITSEKKVSSDLLEEIQISADNASVEVLPTSDTETKVQLVTKGVDVSKLDFTAKVEGKKLIIRLKDKRTFYIGFNIQSSHLYVYVPQKLYHSIMIDNDNGKVKMSELNVKNLNVQTDNGRIELNKIESENVDVRSANGKLNLNEVEGNIKGSANNGKIVLATKDLDRNIQLESDNGKISIKTEKEPTNTTFKVSSDNGSINILDKYKGNTVIGKGDNLVDLKSNNGKIEVVK